MDLTEAYLAKIAGWEAVKHARAFVGQGRVLSSNWTPPVLKGVVEEGGTSYRAGLVIKGSIDIENLCSCRASRQWGTICAHSVAVGLHHLGVGVGTVAGSSASVTKQGQPEVRSAGKTGSSQPPKSGKRLLRSTDGEGETLELFLIIPPNFTQALARGKAMICIEGQWGRGRVPLNVLPLTVPFKLSEPDARVLDRLEELGAGEIPAMIMVSLPEFAGLLDCLAGFPRLTLGRGQAVEVAAEARRLGVDAELTPAGEIRLTLRAGGNLGTLIVGETSWSYADHNFQRLALPKVCAGIFKGAVTLPRAQIPMFLNTDWPALFKACDVRANFKLEDFVLEPQTPRFFLNLAGGIARLEAQLQCGYGTRIMTVGVTSKDESLWMPDPAVLTRYSTRDLASEQKALQRLLRHGFTGPDSNGRYLLVGQTPVLTFFAREFPRLEKEWKVTLEERLERSTAQNIERIEPRLQITTSGEQWFDLNVSYGTTGGERFSAADIQRLVLTGQNHTRLKNGKFAVIDTGAVEELEEVLLDCAPQQHDQGYRMDNAHASYLQASLQDKTQWTVQAPTAWRERAVRQSGEAKLDVPPLGDLETVLRPYQKQGVGWLRFLRANNFGGILADEMGLGKTLQTLAFIRAEQALLNSGEARLPTLVVCPTSLVVNWSNEVRKFTPELRVLMLHGPQRQSAFHQISSSDLVITSYALVRRDADLYRALEFDTVVLDEAQHIKNPQTQNAQAVKAIRARHRLVLTGTPLENSVLDLWSIFDFLMPGYLGAAKDFRERYELPIVRDRNVETQARLARRVKPFLLRRLKRDVAADLPAKIEQVSFCELTEDQRAVYQQVLDAGRKQVMEAVGQQGLQKSRMVVLNTLLRLRQICCDLRLLKLENIDPTSASGKLDLFGELLEEALDGGHRVLVFSQFVSMLKLIEERLKAEELDYCYLDGSTVNRAAVVERFQTQEKIPVFLISLKAGGVGLNLTGADTVVHFDPWWNPAVEDQATDRAHRIGQSRVVTSYKLITRGTVEEKILSLQKRKRDIIQSTLTGEEEFAGSLNWDEIQELLNEG